MHYNVTNRRKMVVCHGGVTLQICISAVDSRSYVYERLML